MVKTVPRAVRFPSPYGEEVLKVERLKDSTRRVSQVSVPLRGRGFESLELESLDDSISISMGFRPLTGKRF